MAEVKNFEDLKSDEVQNSLDGKLKDLIKEIDDFNDENNSNDSLDGVMDKSSELTTSNVLNKELKNALMSADSSIISVLINELKKFQDKEGVFDLINSLTEIQYEKSVNDMDSKFDKSVNDMDSKFDKSANDMNSKFDKSVNDMDSKFDKSVVAANNETIYDVNYLEQPLLDDDEYLEQPLLDDDDFDNSVKDKKDKNSGA